MANFLQSASDLARNLYSQVTQNVSSGLSNVAKQVNQVIPQVEQQTQKVANTSWQDIQNGVKQLGANTSSAFYSPMKQAESSISALPKTFSNFGSNAIATAKSLTPQIGATIQGYNPANLDPKAPINNLPIFPSSQNNLGIVSPIVSGIALARKLNMPSQAEIQAQQQQNALEKRYFQNPSSLTPQEHEQFLAGWAKQGTDLAMGTVGSVDNGIKNTAEKLATKIPFFNTNTYNIPQEAKDLITNSVIDSKNKIQQAVGKTLSNQEVVQTAQASGKILDSVVGRNATQKYVSDLLKTRQQLSAMASEGTVTKDFIDTLMAIKSRATDTARKLQALSIGADPLQNNAKTTLVDALLKQGKSAEEIINASKGVNFNDANQTAELYRNFVKPSKGQWLDTVRYNSMLSSPNTHINNFFSNLGNSAVVAPVEKTVAGGIDFLHSAFTQKSRTMFAGEGGAYLKGYYANLNEASKTFADVVKGTKDMTNLDVKNIPLATKGSAGAIYKTLSVPAKLLDASDQFFQSLTRAGETSALEYRAGKGVNVPNLPVQAEKSAQYRLYRNPTDSANHSGVEGKFSNPQGYLLSSIDSVTSKINQLRASSNPVTSFIAKFTMPFVQTPMNILKQGIEYSPAGIATLPGNADKTTQLAKVAIGTTGASLAALLGASGRLTTSQPTSPKDLAAYKQAGLQPWSVKIGDNWVGYDKLPPAVAYPLAITASMYDAYKNKTLNDGQFQTILTGIGEATRFFSDQSYVKNLGDIVNLVNGTENAKSQLGSNYAQQVIPFRAFTGWIARLLDPYQRQIDPGENWVQKQVDLLKQQYPGLREQTGTLNDSQGNPLPAKQPIVNAFSPVKVSPENPQAKQTYENLQQQQTAGREAKQIDQADPQLQDIASQKGQQEQQVASLYTKLKALPREQANARYESLLQSDPNLAGELKSYVTAQKQLNDFSYEEKVVNALPITGGSRALYVYKKAQNMQTREEKNAYIADLESKGIITPRILKQLQILITNNGIIPKQ